MSNRISALTIHKYLLAVKAELKSFGIKLSCNDEQSAIKLIRTMVMAEMGEIVYKVTQDIRCEKGML